MLPWAPAEAKKEEKTNPGSRGPKHCPRGRAGGPKALSQREGGRKFIELYALSRERRAVRAKGYNRKRKNRKNLVPSS